VLILSTARILIAYTIHNILFTDAFSASWFGSLAVNISLIAANGSTLPELEILQFKSFTPQFKVPRLCIA